MWLRMHRIVALIALLMAWSTVGTCATANSAADLDTKIPAVLPTLEEDAFLEIPWRLNILGRRLPPHGNAPARQF